MLLLYKNAYYQANFKQKSNQKQLPTIVPLQKKSQAMTDPHKENTAMLRADTTCLTLSALS